MTSTLIPAESLPSSAAELAEHSALLVVDCRFQLSDPQAGRRAYVHGHVPGAVYADLERDLSGPVVRGRTGRHPLPDPERLAAQLRAWGMRNDSRVVAYDDAGGAMAARLWWLCRWLGHDEVAVLDGGYQAWLAAGGEASCEPARPAPGDFQAALRPELVLSTAELSERLVRGDVRLFDARAPQRFRGEVEPIDPVAGHLPGARCLPFADNLEGGRFRGADDLRLRYAGAMGDTPVERVVMYCGSGVTACHDILAAAHAGLGMPRLYAGSFSEWITDPAREVVTGD